LFLILDTNPGDTKKDGEDQEVSLEVIAEDESNENVNEDMPDKDE
jgi:hypothetical protein